MSLLMGLQLFPPPASAQTIWIAAENTQNGNIRAQDVSIPVAFSGGAPADPMGAPFVVTTTGVLMTDSRVILSGGITVDRKAAGYWVTTGNPGYPQTQFTFTRFPIGLPTHVCSAPGASWTVTAPTTSSGRRCAAAGFPST